MTHHLVSVGMSVNPSVFFTDTEGFRLSETLRSTPLSRISEVNRV